MTEVLGREGRTIGPMDQGQWILSLLERQYGLFLSFLIALPQYFSKKKIHGGYATLPPLPVQQGAN